ncbi:hypothetical protein H0264_01010 [Nocardia huaxiensis]|uniref:Uncharacterized protein n=1 Tax=Nocardia huaxiensis TaxID=2755382 RepID=A0A7D6VEJ9_9NOCA|nr:hypothetical protein [Nocardia huaxiensis]QLY31017.1 hypothetical protein H0264_01010 [Nocardia huaxiensis]
MSHQSATSAARTFRRTSQVLRYSAVVTASMASIGLTVAAGSYISNEIAGTQKSGNIFAVPAAPGGPAYERELEGGELSVDIAAVAETTSVNTLFHTWGVERGAPATISPVRPAEPGTSTPIAGQLRLGDTFVGAQVFPVQRNSLTVTVDTNVFAAVGSWLLSGPIGERLGLTADPSATTQVRTELDTRRGDVKLTITDPAIGDLGLQLARHPAPAATAANEEGSKDGQAVTGDATTAPVHPEDSATTAV